MNTPTATDNLVWLLPINLMGDEMEKNPILDIAIEYLIAGMAERDLEERQHCRRVEKLCAMTAAEMNWNSEEISDLKLAALLHHMDRSLVPQSAISRKVAAYLTSFNRRKANPHVRLLTLADRADEGASIIAVSDTFDRLTSLQRYRRPLNEKDALEILKRDAEGTVDERTVEAFARSYMRELQNCEQKAA
ncbi:MAG: hypothetical protein QHH26_09245 [Armatimonadota bacterium]|nr:hypothetical protein [Armatimonadota bacterium]